MMLGHRQQPDSTAAAN